MNKFIPFGIRNTIDAINGYEFSFIIHKNDKCAFLSVKIWNEEDRVCLESCDEYCDHTIQLKDYTKDELNEAIVDYIFGKYRMFTQMIDDIKEGTFDDALNIYYYGYEFISEFEESFQTLCASFTEDKDGENDRLLMNIQC